MAWPPTQTKMTQTAAGRFLYLLALMNVIRDSKRGAFWLPSGLVHVRKAQTSS
jgi:hypothetical protein